MCGIAGFTGAGSSELLQSFQQLLRHRGPDEEGYYSHEEIGLCSTRLAIIDLAGGRQPIFNEDGSCCIVCNGEIYNYRELRSELEPRHRFRTASDTEVVLHLYEELGVDAPARLKGDFALCIWDGPRHQLLLSRDPLGVKPLFYALTGAGRLVFGSELTVLLRHPEVAPELDPEAVSEYFTRLCVAPPRSFIRGVQKLLPGESLLWRPSEVRKWRYWQPPEVAGAPIRPADFEARARELLEQAVRRRLIADVPVGAFLSGGLDSSLIVALASRESPGLQTFAIGYAEEDFDELKYARQVSRRFGTEHHEFVIRPDQQQLLESVIAAMDEPIADSSAVPTFLVARETRAFVKVALSGVGGDELFAGYPRYLGARLSERVPAWAARGIAGLSGFFESRPTGRDWGGWIRRFGAGVGLPAWERYWGWTTFIDPVRLRELLTLPVSGEPGCRAEAEDFFRRGSGGYLDTILRFDLERYLAADLLKFGDTMTMANSLELRVPFCDQDLVAEVARTPAEIRFPGYRLKSVLRRMAAECLPREIVQRRKQGFMIPIGRWFRRELRGYLEDQLAPSKVPAFLNPRAVQQLLAEHVAGRENHTHLLWALLVLTRWLRQHPEIRQPHER